MTIQKISSSFSDSPPPDDANLSHDQGFNEIRDLALSVPPSPQDGPSSLIARNISPVLSDSSVSSSSSEDSRSSQSPTPPPLFRGPSPISIVDRLRSMSVVSPNGFSIKIEPFVGRAPISIEDQLNKLLSKCKKIPRTIQKEALKQAAAIYEELNSMRKILKNEKISFSHKAGEELDYRFCQALIYRKTPTDLEVAESILSRIVNKRVKLSTHSLYASLLIRLKKWEPLVEFLLTKPKINYTPDIPLFTLIQSVQYISHNMQADLVVFLLEHAIKMEGFDDLDPTIRRDIYYRISDCHRYQSRHAEANEYFEKAQAISKKVR